MISANKIHNVRLYLQKDGKEDIYIDTCPLPQHQIDGVRFLFRQFKKKKPGVIINNPAGYGKTVQVALFLNAVRNLLKNPVLILCKDDSEVEHWIETFKTWTKYNMEDIEVESKNVFVKKAIFIKKAIDIAVYSRRDWCMVVVKNDFAPKDMLKVPIKAEYKIWLTAIDMKKDMDMLNSIYGWLYCEKKFNIESFINSKTNCNGPLNKLILLDAFLEDVVITRNDFQTPFRTQKVSQEEVSNTVQKITRKNKDATGTKIKRSKIKIKDMNVPCSRFECNLDTSTTNLTISNMDVDAEETIDEFSIDKYSKNDNSKIKKKDDVVETDIESFNCDKETLVCQYEFTNDTNMNTMDINGDNITFTETITDIFNNENKKLEDNDINNYETVVSHLSKDEIQKVHVNDEVHIDNIKPSINVTSKDQNGENDSVPISSSYIIKNTTNIEDNVDRDNNSHSNDIRQEAKAHKPEAKHQDKEKTVRDIDYKISKMEEMTMKKFKGSLLDSLF